MANALRLDEAERAHLHNLAYTSRSTSRTLSRRRPAPIVRPSLLRLLDSMTSTAAFVRNNRLDVLAINPLGRALYAPVYDTPGPANLARFCFLDPAARGFYPHWDNSADTTVALFRTAAGQDPYDKALTDLIGELVTRSEPFRNRWSRHDVRSHRTGVKQFHHPLVGSLDLDFDALDLPGTGLTLTAYSAAHGTPDADALTLLASWKSSDDNADSGGRVAGPRVPTFPTS